MHCNDINDVWLMYDVCIKWNCMVWIISGSTYSNANPLKKWYNLIYHLYLITSWVSHGSHIDIQVAVNKDALLMDLWALVLNEIDHRIELVYCNHVRAHPNNVAALPMVRWAKVTWPWTEELVHRGRQHGILRPWRNMNRDIVSHIVT